MDCFCGNGSCHFDEDNTTCPADCFCGNMTCDIDEDATSCAADCA